MADQSGERPQPKEQSALKLEIKKVAESAEPINKNHRIRQTLHVDGYTLFWANEDNQIHMYNDLAEKKELPLDLKSATTHVNWHALTETGKEGGFTLDSSDRYYTVVSNLPPDLRVFVTKYIEAKRSRLIQTDALESQLISNTDEIEYITSPDGRYFVTYNKYKQSFVIINTQDDEGNRLSPRNWKRRNPDSREPRPAELEPLLKFISESDPNHRIKMLNERYVVRTTPDRVEIFVSNDFTSPLMVEKIARVDNAFCFDGTTLYMCDCMNATELVALNLTTGKSVSMHFKVDLPKPILSLTLDPTNNFILIPVYNNSLVFDKNTLEQVGTVPAKNISFNKEGNLIGVDSANRMVVYETNLAELAQENVKNRLGNLVDSFAQQGGEEDKKAAQQESKINLEIYRDIKTKFEDVFRPAIQQADDLSQIGSMIRKILDAMDKMNQDGAHPDVVKFVAGDVLEEAGLKRTELIQQQVEPVITRIESMLEAGLSITTLTSIKQELDIVHVNQASLTGDLKDRYLKVVSDLNKKSTELFKQQGDIIIQDLNELIQGVETRLKSITSQQEFDMFVDRDIPRLKLELGTLQRSCPVEADTAMRAITEANRKLLDLTNFYEKKFAQDYAVIRERAAEQLTEMKATLADDINAFANRLRRKKFQTRDEAEQFLHTTDVVSTLKVQIDALRTKDQEAAVALDTKLQVEISQVLFEIEQASKVNIAETGQQMVLFGKTLFPKWEAHVAQQGQKKVDLTFQSNQASLGPGVRGNDILGDVSVIITNSDGKQERVRLWQDKGLKEDDYRYGIDQKAIPSSYLSKAEYNNLLKQLQDWNRGDASTLRQELRTRQQALKDFYATRPADGPTEEWKRQCAELLQQYQQFYLDNNVSLLKHIDTLKEEPEVTQENGKGFVPTWQSHWVLDSHTEHYLEEMAKALKMQSELQEGILDLKGHAGTGKDVLVKMFCAQTNRPYFSIDCTKWTTEYELSEDVVLEAENGASRTVKMPSVVLQAITTPGAVMYFNEINGMPEQAQIFLHGLLDEKRTLTLKTSAGKTIKADPSVLLMSSRNPGYPGTFEPQMATKSRMVPLEVGYPSLTREPKQGDPNPNKPYAASEALRIARGVDSLKGLTYEANLDRNRFVKAWDAYVNRESNDAEKLTQTQQFDLEVILALVQFSDQLRDNFIMNFEGSRDARKALPVRQPVTGRELRRCAHMLNQIPAETKTNANPEAIAKELLERFFLSQIDKQEEKEKVKQSLATWTSKRRLAA